MSEVAVFSNTIRRRRRRNPESKAKRRRAARLGWAHRRRHRNPESHSERSAAARKGWRRRHHDIGHRAYYGKRRRYRNPIGGEMGQVLVPAAIGAAGALGINVLLGYATFLPASFSSGYGRAAVQVGAGLAVGAFGTKLGLSRRTSMAIASGITLIAVYDVVSTLVASKFPNINLGENFAMLPPSFGRTGNAIASGGFGENFQIPASTAANMLPNHTFQY